MELREVVLVFSPPSVNRARAESSGGGSYDYLVRFDVELRTIRAGERASLPAGAAECSDCASLNSRRNDGRTGVFVLVNERESTGRIDGSGKSEN